MLGFLLSTGVSNWLGIIVAAIVSMIISIVWYSPALFGRRWLKLQGRNPRDAGRMMKAAGPMYVLSLAAAIISAIVLQLFIGDLSITSAWMGAALGLVVWIGFVSMGNLGMAMLSRKPVKLYVLENLHLLIAFIIMGAILVLV
ncbi:MAG: DUF1761 domain-containing protein [Candidatus Micrarchaeaceae archaeon]|nr:DUF1761 domain-containing protein [Candidatus Micrarchaeota archaeon]HII10346.1 DUF1761 domain-containing protein [Candidatus Micrarchaeota archaeon]